MLYYPNSFPYDSAIGVVSIYYGIGFAVFLFVAVVLIEAWVMKVYFETTVRPGTFWLKYIPLPFIQRIKYSFIINTISTVAGLPLAYYLSWHMPDWAGFYGLLTCAFSITIVIEFFSLVCLLRPKPSFWEALQFTVLANLSSYAAILILSWLLPR